MIEQLCKGVRQQGFVDVAKEQEADRSLVIGSADRWIFSGDSAGSTEWSDSEAFKALSRFLSELGPVVDVLMSDDAAIHFYLYHQGQLIDKFGNAKFPFFRFDSEEEAAPYRGHPELWKDLLVNGNNVDALRTAWVQDWRAREILAETGRLLGWNAELQWVGYTFDDEGLPIKYDEFLRHSGLDLNLFDEYHFKRA
jgi:hypothetical protein